MLNLVIALVIGAPAFALAAVVDHRAKQRRRNQLSNGAHLVLLDESLSPSLVRDALYASDPSLDIERQLRDAELAHLAAEVVHLREQQQGQSTGAIPADAERADAAQSAAREFHDRRLAITFKPDEPTLFESFTGQEHIVRPLSAAVAALEPTRRVPSHKLFTGLPGRGKTLLAKVIGHELQRRARHLGLPPLAFFETFASNLDTIADLDAVATTIREAGGGVWFIDEIHVLKHELSTKIFALMEDAKYPFHGSVTATPMPEVMVIGATTDYGKLHPALKRRFGEPMMVRPMTRNELLKLVLNRTFPITTGAAELLVERTHLSGAPYEAINLREQAEVFARAATRKQITVPDVEEVFRVYEIDALGLRWMDREVLRALFRNPRFRKGGTEFVAYAASERDVCGIAGVDPEEYRESIKPRLLSRRLIEVRTGYGQAITPHGVELYQTLKAA